LYINDCLETPYVHLTLFADDMYIYHRLWRGLCSQRAATWPNLSGIMVWMLEHKNQWIKYSGHPFHLCRPVEICLILRGQDMLFVNQMK
jgi:hypothetical protein